MLVEPSETSYDLRFWLFGTRVRIHPLFWLFSAILGWDFLELGFLYLFLWVATCFVSVLLHEFGHVWMGKVFGARDSHIVLYSFGGLAVGSNDLWDRWKRICVSLAGPGIELALYGVLRLVLWSVEPAQLARLPHWAWMALIMLMEINLLWALFNLLPVWPLDGGMVAREVCTWVSPRGGLRFSLGLSIAIAGFIALHGLLAKGRGAFVIPYLPTSNFSIILFAVLAIESWQLLQAARRQPSWETDDRMPWESDPDAWKRR
jgi:Zn-dependent protease